MWGGKMIVNDELERMWMNVAMTCVKVEFKHLPGILRDGWFQG
jgi:hypothetical protein